MLHVRTDQLRRWHDRAQDWVPPIAMRGILKCLARANYLVYPDKQTLRANEVLKGTGSGRRAFVLATGPSLKGEDLKVLAGEECFSVSNFMLHPDIETVCPRFHFFAPYHPPLVLADYIRWLRLADERLPQSTALFLGHKTRKLVEAEGVFRDRRVFYLHISHCDSLPFVPIDITKTIMAPQTGPQMILPVLFYMGYTSVYLLGCDQTALRDFRRVISHFYEHASDVRRNASDKAAWTETTVDHLKAHQRAHMQYACYAKEAHRCGWPVIVNLSQDSWIDAFPFARLQDVVRTKGASGGAQSSDGCRDRVHALRD